MKSVSIITITKDDGVLLDSTVRSVRAQTVFDRIEHVIVDGGTKPLPRYEGVDVRRMPPRGVYSAINEGIRCSSAPIVGMVHGNDIFASDRVVEHVLDIFDADPELDFVYGSLVYRNCSSGKICRKYDSGKFKPELLDCGFGPAHPTLFARRRVFESVGLYDESFRISGDFEMWLRLFDPQNSFKWHFEPEVMTVMTKGGISSRLSNQLTVNVREKLRALRMHGHPANIFSLLRRFFYL